MKNQADRGFLFHPTVLACPSEMRGVQSLKQQAPKIVGRVLGL